jgi:lipopolysaccharide export system protein LptC
MTKRQIQIYIALLFLGLGSWLIAYFIEEKQATEYTIADHSPDYFSEGYHKREMDLNGALKSELFATKMTHYSDDGTTHLDNPIMTLYNSAQSPPIPPWVIKSDMGILEADGDHLLLAGHVYISRDKAKGLRLFKINTSELYVTLSNSFAETSEEAELIDDKNKTKGLGFEINFMDPIRIKFLSHVRGRYVFN